MLITLKLKLKGAEKVFISGEEGGVIIIETVEIKDKDDDVQMALSINAVQDAFLKRHVEVECFEANKGFAADGGTCS